MTAARQGAELSARDLPHDAEAERATLGACMLDPGVIPLVQAIVGPDDFHHPAASVVFSIACELSARGEAVDPVTVGAALRERGKYNAVGGVHFLGNCVDSCPSVSLAEDYAAVVKRDSDRRRVYAISQQMREAAHRGDRAEDVISRAQASLSAIPSRTRGSVGLGAAMIEEMERYADKMQLVADGLADESAGVPWGIPSIDAMNPSGQGAGEVTVIGARPSVGKSAFAQQTGVNCAVNTTLGEVLFFSLEMKARVIARRMICALAAKLSGIAVPQHVLLTGRPTEQQALAIQAVMGAPLADYDRVRVIDDFGIGTRGIRAACHRHRAQGKRLALVVVDYLQLLAGVGGDSDDATSEKKTSDNSRALKVLAGELEVPLIALSQLNRQSVKETREPCLADLRHSGAIEQDADRVILLHRPDLKESKVKIIFAKNRNDPPFDVECVYTGYSTTFSDTSETHGSFAGRDTEVQPW